jgi:hypothetical protein
MGPFRSSHRHGPPLLGRVQGRPCSPTSSLVCSPPTPCLHRPRLRFPLPAAYLVADACSVPERADDTCARQRAVRRRRVTGSPLHRNLCEERRGPPGLRGHPLRTCCGRTPRRIRPPPRPTHAEGHCCLRSISALSASGKHIGFGAAVPRPARSRAYASPMSFLTPSQGWLPARAGSPLAGRVLHPLDDKQSFMEA